VGASSALGHSRTGSTSFKQSTRIGRFNRAAIYHQGIGMEDLSNQLGQFRAPTGKVA